MRMSLRQAVAAREIWRGQTKGRERKVIGKFRAKSANSWLATNMRRYIAMCRKIPRNFLNVVGMSCDGKRVLKKHALMVGFKMPLAKVACWGPPQVHCLFVFASLVALPTCDKLYQAQRRFCLWIYSGNIFYITCNCKNTPQLGTEQFVE